MFQKLFHIALVLFLVIFSVAGIALLITGIAASIPPSLLSGTEGISAVAGGLSEKFLTLLGVSLLVAAMYLLWRWRRN